MHEKDKVFGGFVVLTILAVAGIVALAPSTTPPPTQVGSSGDLLAFDSYEQMKSFVTQASSNYQESLDRTDVLAFASGAVAPSAATSTSSFTTTNVQVEGVDEPDLVKTDGTYIYVAHQGNVSIILAQPGGVPTTVSVLRYGGQVLGLFLSDGRLTVIVTGSSVINSWTEDFNKTSTGNATDIASYPVWIQTTSVVVYDVTDPANPAEMRTVSIDGSYVDARMSEGYVYAVLQQSSYRPLDNGTYGFAPPQVMDGKNVIPISADDTYYNPKSLVPVGTYTIIVTISLIDGSHTQEAVLTGWGSTVYATSTNIYLAFPDRMEYPMLGIAALPVGASIMPTRFWWGWGTNTTIFRVAITGDHTEVAAQGTVPGTVLNQFSIDEYNGNLRVATTSYANRANFTSVQLNNVFVLDSSLKAIGSLEGLAPNERIYSVRFLGDVGFVVTFEQVDPLFAISFADPTHPVVLSALELTGFSDYLHPIGNGYLIGVGKDTIPAPQEQGFVLYQGVKISIFHVASDGSSSETDRVIIGDRGSQTPVSYDHRAFTYDATRGIVAIPIYVAVLQDPSNSSWWEYGKGVFQGAYLFNVTATGGIHRLGTVTQIPQGADVEQSYSLYVNRVLIIGDFVYTISDSMVQVNGLADMSLVGALKL